MRDIEHEMQKELRLLGVVYAAAVVTFVGATGTALLTAFLTAGILLMGAPIFETFDDELDLRWYVVGAAFGVIGLCAAADVTGVMILRGRRWARWALIALSALAAGGGLMSAYYVAPLAITAAAVAVVVLLFLPTARAWFGAVDAETR